jgi:GNAT superfamily N-acetyltransferase
MPLTVMNVPRAWFGRFLEMVIEPYDDSMLDAIIRLSLRAWEPVFESLRVAMGPDVFHAFYRDDWRAAQRNAVESVCTDGDVHVWVALEESRTAGFVALKLHPEDQMGEIYMIATDPEFQRRGVAAGLTSHSVEWFKSAGMSIAMVETGGDPGHAPARRAYESSGFRLLPVARYFKTLQ